MNQVLDLTDFTLQHWIEELLLRSGEELCEKYGDEDAVYQEIGYTHLETSPVMEGLVEEKLIVQLHEKLRNLPCEDPIWDGVVWYLGQPLPTFIAHDFIDRWIVVFSLAVSHQHEQINWRLVKECRQEEPLLWMAKERYENDNWSLSDWESFLIELVNFYEGDSYPLKIVTGWQASSDEKENAFYELVLRHSEQKEIIEYRDRQQLDQNAFNKFYDQLQEAGTSDVGIEELHRLYDPSYADYLLHLAQHKESTSLLLQKLSQFKKSKFASKIRAAAKSELYRRQKLSLKNYD